MGYSLKQTIDSPSERTDDEFGYSVSLYGNYLVVGDVNTDPDGNGAVYFYRISPSSGKFDLIQTIDSPSEINNDLFGVSVSLYGNYLVVGDNNAKSGATAGKGAAYFYKMDR